VGALTDVLGRHALVGIDTSIFIYQLEASERYVNAAEEVLEALADGAFEGVTSVVTLIEVTVRPHQLGRADVADDYCTSLGNYPHLTIVELHASTARRAAELRAAYRLHPADALQVAACLTQGATAFLTNDKGLRRLRELEVMLLDDFVAEN